MADVTRYEPYLEQLHAAITDPLFPQFLQTTLKSTIPAEIQDDQSLADVFQRMYKAISDWYDTNTLPSQKRDKYFEELNQDRTLSERLRKKIRKKWQHAQLTPENGTQPTSTFDQMLAQSHKLIEQHNKLKAAMTWIAYGMFVFVTVGLGFIALKKMQRYTEKLKNQRNYAGECFADSSLIMQGLKKEKYQACDELNNIISSVEQQFLGQVSDEYRVQADLQRAENKTSNLYQQNPFAHRRFEMEKQPKSSALLVLRDHTSQQSFARLASLCTLFRDSIYQHPVLRYSHTLQFDDKESGYAKLPLYIDSAQFGKMLSVDSSETKAMLYVVEIARNRADSDEKILYLHITENKIYLPKGFYTYNLNTMQLNRIEDLKEVLNRPVEHNGIQGFLGIMDVVDSRSNDVFNYDIAYLAMLPQPNQHIHYTNILSIDPWSRHAKLSNGDVIMSSSFQSLTLYDMNNLEKNSKGKPIANPIREYHLDDTKQMPPISIAVSQDDKVVAGLFFNRTVAFWEVATGKLLNYYQPTIKGSNKNDLQMVFFWKSIRFDEGGNLVISECQDSRYSPRNQVLPYHVENTLDGSPQSTGSPIQLPKKTYG